MRTEYRAEPYTEQELNSITLDNIQDTTYKPEGKVSGPIHGGALQVESFGFLMESGDAALSYFYNLPMNKPNTRRLVEVLGGKKWVRDEYFG